MARSIVQSVAPCQKQNGTFSAAAWRISSRMLLHSTMQPPLGKVIFAATRAWHDARPGSAGWGISQAYQEERAALMEYDGRLPRDEAERLAWVCIQRIGDV